MLLHTISTAGRTPGCSCCWRVWNCAPTHPAWNCPLLSNENKNDYVREQPFERLNVWKLKGSYSSCLLPWVLTLHSINTSRLLCSICQCHAPKLISFSNIFLSPTFSIEWTELSPGNLWWSQLLQITVIHSGGLVIDSVLMYIFRLKKKTTIKLNADNGYKLDNTKQIQSGNCYW